LQARAQPGRPPRPRHLRRTLLAHGGERYEVVIPVGAQVAPARLAQFPFGERAVEVQRQRELLRGRERERARAVGQC
jgi:hypothetical protein